MFFNRSLAQPIWGVQFLVATRSGTAGCLNLLKGQRQTAAWPFTIEFRKRPNKLITWYGRFLILLLLANASSCKNNTAKNQVKYILKNQAQNTYRTTHSTEIDPLDQADQATTSTANQMTDPHPDESLKADAEPTHPVDVPPSFSLKDISIKAGTQQSTMLEVTGQTEGYVIKSISVKAAKPKKNATKQNRDYYTKEFQVKQLEGTSIPSSGLCITVTADPALQARRYLLNIRIGKKGKGSRKTEQSVQCIIDVIKDEAKDDKKNVSNNEIPQNDYATDNEHDCLNQDETDTLKEHLTQSYTIPAEPRFTLKDMTIQAGSTHPIMLKATGITDKYFIKSISVTLNNHSYTSEFGIALANKKPIQLSDWKAILTTNPTLKPGNYALKINIGQIGKGSKKQNNGYNLPFILLMMKKHKPNRLLIGKVFNE
ncbi:hypothetical protein CE557_035 [Cardinium endosymbiont of Sogatella furcifera]|uniref:hypothetical protein n=1 Tax=Cardinium endosymbiont of Sogatella furcifera TaxID=650378 RepID=UPI000E0DAB24|nr:hypothetical protein [Cardinium endosymbiont of Sogatella furcifera]AXI23882.1 hypothetical protein CE557_035 [Cardinium endosymbiont of Sogatella furcifera]